MGEIKSIKLKITSILARHNCLIKWMPCRLPSSWKDLCLATRRMCNVIWQPDSFWKCRGLDVELGVQLARLAQFLVCCFFVSWQLPAVLWSPRGPLSANRLVWEAEEVGAV